MARPRVRATLSQEARSGLDSPLQPPALLLAATTSNAGHMTIAFIISLLRRALCVVRSARMLPAGTQPFADARYTAFDAS